MWPWERALTGGPDAARYIALSEGRKVPRPFHLRWLLPRLCGTSGRAWWTIWLGSWPVLAAGIVGWRVAAGDGWQVAFAAGVLLLALPGVLGPSAVIPVGVDLPATALTMCAALSFELGGPYWAVAGMVVVAVAACVRETSPVWCALCVWSPLPLVGLVAPLVRQLTSRTGPDPLGPRFDEIAAHPVRAALEAHRRQWRDGWVMVAPWGVCLAALYSPDWRLVVVLAVAYLQLVVATDTVRLLHHAAGPSMAVAAAQNIPTAWLFAACAVHVVWWRNVERV